MKRICIPVVIASLALLSGSELAFSQNSPSANPNDPPELIARRSDFLRGISRAQIPIYVSYLRTLEPLKQQFAREGKTDAARAVDDEISSIKSQLDAAQKASDISTAAPVQFHIDSAFWGDPPSKQLRDVTSFVKTGFDSGSPTMTLGKDTLGGGDPAPYKNKLIVIKYTINGKPMEKTFKSDYVLNFKRDLH